MRNINVKKFARPRRHKDERIVQNDLAYTPTQMMQLAEQGIAVSTMTAGNDMFFDGVPVSESTFNLPLDACRGVDVADCWQAEQTVRKKAKKGLKNDISRYGTFTEQAKIMKGE